MERTLDFIEKLMNYAFSKSKKIKKTSFNIFAKFLLRNSGAISDVRRNPCAVRRSPQFFDLVKI